MIYFNNAASSYPKPPIVNETVQEILKQPFLESNRSMAGNMPDYIQKTRDIISSLFNLSDPQKVILTSSATESLNMVLQGLTKKLGNIHIISSFREHNSVLRPLFHLLREKKISLTLINPSESGGLEINDIKAKIRKETRIVVLTHVSNTDGFTNDIEKIGEYCKNNNIIFIVDAAQSAGIRPIDIMKYNISFLIFAGHKHLFGFPGTGGFLINSEIQPEAIKYGGTGVRSDALYQPKALPYYYECGTPAYPAIASLYAGCKFILDYKIENISSQVSFLTNYFREKITQIEKIKTYNSNQTDCENGIISFNINGIKPEDAGYILHESFGIVVRTGLHCAPLAHRMTQTYPEGTIRASLSIFNTTEEIDYFSEALKKISI